MRPLGMMLDSCRVIAVTNPSWFAEISPWCNHGM